MLRVCRPAFQKRMCITMLHNMLHHIPLDHLYHILDAQAALKTVVLMPDVDQCVACRVLAGEHGKLSVGCASRPSHPTVYSECGVLRGELNFLRCEGCGARHFMSCCEGGDHLKHGKQLAYPGAMLRSNQWIQVSRDTVFEKFLIYRLDQQMVHSHTGFETFCIGYVRVWGESANLVGNMRGYPKCATKRSWHGDALLLAPENTCSL